MGRLCPKTAESVSTARREAGEVVARTAHEASPSRPPESRLEKFFVGAVAMTTALTPASSLGWVLEYATPGDHPRALSGVIDRLTHHAEIISIEGVNTLGPSPVLLT